MAGSMTSNSPTGDRLMQEIVFKLWNFCNVLKDDGVTDRSLNAPERCDRRWHLLREKTITLRCRSHSNRPAHLRCLRSNP
jgi:hypothetical protein